MKPYLRLLKYLYPHGSIILITWAFSLLVLALQGISVWVGGGFIEKLLTKQPLGMGGGDSGALATFMDSISVKVLQQSTPFKSLMAGVGVLVGAGLLTALFRIVKLYLFIRVNQQILTQIRTEMFSHLTRLDLLFSRRYKHGEIVSLFTGDVNQLRMAIFDIADRIFMQPLRLIMSFALMFSLSVDITLWVIVLLIFSSFAIHFAGDRIEVVSRRLMEKGAKLQGHLTEYLSVVVLARSLGREEEEKTRFHKACRDLADTDIELSMTDAVSPQIVKNLFFLTGGVLLIVGGHKVLVSQTMTGGALIKMTLLLPVATYPLEALASLYVSVRSSIASAKRIFRFLDEEETSRDLPDALEPGPFGDRIELRNVGYVVDGVPIIRNVSLAIPHGSKVIVHGPSGAGKTTLLSLVAALARCTSGSIQIDGVDLRRLKSMTWRQRLGIVPQEPILLNGTIRDNLLYARPDAEDKLLQHVLGEALMWGEEHTFAKGLDTEVGNRGEMLSGGERQRLAIARALLNDPEVLLMDEPTAMLDRSAKEKIRDSIYSVAQGKTLFLATHDPFLHEIADILIKIESGRVVEIKSSVA